MESGKKQIESNYLNNLKNGKFVSYLESGKILEDSFYKDDVLLDGIVNTYFDSENIMEKKVYKNQKLNGLQQTFFETGKIKAEINYSNDIPVGVKTEYYETGKIKEKTSFSSDGNINVFISYKENGEEIYKIKYTDNQPNFDSFSSKEFNNLSNSNIMGNYKILKEGRNYCIEQIKKENKSISDEMTLSIYESFLMKRTMTFLKNGILLLENFGNEDKNIYIYKIIDKEIIVKKFDNISTDEIAYKFKITNNGNNILLNENNIIIIFTKVAK